jgi:hypothetical protein
MPGSRWVTAGHQTAAAAGRDLKACAREEVSVVRARASPYGA